MRQTSTEMRPLIHLEEQLGQFNMRQASADVFFQCLGAWWEDFSFVVGHDQLTFFNTNTLVAI